jgi:hypothetical protein
MFCRLDSPSAVITDRLVARRQPGIAAGRHDAARVVQLLPPESLGLRADRGMAHGLPIATPATPRPVASTATTARRCRRRRS